VSDTEGTVHFEMRGEWGLATLDRPARRNALNAEMCDQLRSHIQTRPDMRALVIAGEGPAFCAGADLVTRFDAGEDTFRPAFDALQAAIERHPGVVIASVHGPAIGAGTQLLTACDIVLAGPSAKFGIPAAKLGIVMSPGNLVRLVRRVGDLAARDLVMTADTIDVSTALRIGLVSRLVDDVRGDAATLAERVAALAPLSMAGHKAGFAIIDGGLDDAALNELRAVEARAFASADLREGVAAFREKRPPRFEGR